ncbi:PGC-1 and ERR-induced regulator in muscle protein 1 isoform X3 [Crotalus tigris]|uniref:PGC-1 and ERR-induced regulator in muscle protein 1 isoform X3 n=1 Tax=Crotalus tigris TaxID=88082 RepID=UPI00192F990C|nr:PGC-1 and ERR-induced regulator in muscle protein 1 isoform X3 [Crotalus tigris]
MHKRQNCTSSFSPAPSPRRRGKKYFTTFTVHRRLIKSARSFAINRLLQSDCNLDGLEILEGDKVKCQIFENPSFGEDEKEETEKQIFGWKILNTASS